VLSQGHQHAWPELTRHDGQPCHRLHAVAEAAERAGRRLSPHSDDDDFTTLRRKLMRWAADNALLLKDANPVMPPGFSNRVTANWCLLLAIADVAGGLWPAWARAAAVNLSHMRHQPSERLRLLAALQPIFATREQIPSA